ncbi:serine hydrolase domain-containing protein [Elizabethkingia miricola]|uniref:serine hydrolase domain-containing protein n=1 Tax=Elizabethkingia miricola TaxID=172045 RepID=UPI00389279CC
MEKRLLDQMSTAINLSEYSGINSVIIAKKADVLYERYFNGYTRDSLHDSRSSFKSITSLLIGIAIDKGFIKSVNQKVYEFFPGNKILKTDVLKSKITIKDLLEMRSGIDCEEFYETKICEDDMSLSRDWVEFSLNRPMKTNPGELWSYTSVNPMICSGILTNATGMSVVEFAKKYLFDPLGIQNYKWTIDPAGNAMTAGSFYILPKDMLKIGLLVKNNGKWKNRQIVSEKWIHQSTECDIVIPEFSFMKSSRSKIGIPQPTYYGFYWYKELLKTNDVAENLLFASGNGGQYIFIVKDLDLTVVFTQSNYGSYKAKQAFEIMAKYIIPAVKAGEL